MRKIKRLIRNALAEWRIRDRRDEVAAEIQAVLKIDISVELESSGAMGHDSNYYVTAGGKRVAVLRLVNPFKGRQQPAANMPFMLEDPEKRIAREWSVLHAGSRYGLTPQPLWHTHDALLTAYLPMQPLQREIDRDPGRVWNILAAAAGRIAALHGAGITHMDMSPANILQGDGKTAFVDFEYAPAPGISPAQQRLYDHLRLLESAYKYIPENLRGGYGAWLAAFHGILDHGMRAADLAPLLPALGRVFGDAHLARDIKALLT